MKVLIAGATGAIGKALLTCLDHAGHEIFALVRSPKGKVELAAKNANEVVADALDAESVLKAVRHINPDAIINELTSLPKHYTPEEMKAAAPRDKEVRTKGNVNLLAAARAANCNRYVLQSSAFWYAPGPGLADETTPFAFDASPGIAAGCRTYADLEAAAQSSGLQTTILRYGFFYGPGTWFTQDGDVGEQVRRRELPVIGKGEGIWNWIHVDDAATATCAALSADVGVYNVVDNQPVPQSVWLPAFAKFIGAPEPSIVSEASAGRDAAPSNERETSADLGADREFVALRSSSEEQALQSAGADAVYYATKLRGASNGKAKEQLVFRPRPLEWLNAWRIATV